jgi:hypothetical protein
VTEARKAKLVAHAAYMRSRNGRRRPDGSPKLEPVKKGQRRPKREPHGLKPGEALYAAESLKPGITKAEAARAAGLDFVPNGAAVTRYRAELIQKQLEAADVTAERTLREIARVAYFDPRRLFDGRGNLVPIPNLDDDTAAAIAGLDVERRTEGRGEDAEVYYVLKVKLASKVQALDLLTRLDVERQKAVGGSLQPPAVNISFVQNNVTNGGGGE